MPRIPVALLLTAIAWSQVACQVPARTFQEEEGAGEREIATEPEFHNELSFAVGEFNEASEKGARFAIDYERRAPEGWGFGFDERWGFGGFADFYVNPVESLLLGAQAVFHPIEPVSLVLAGGFNNNEDPDTGNDTWLLRLGSRYSFDLSPEVAIGPEIFYDVMENGARRGVFAFALTYRF